MLDFITDMLECPSCHGRLEWEIEKQTGERIESAEARCQVCAAVYPIREGIGVFLTPDLPRNDLWEQLDNGLIQHLRQNPELEQRLMDNPLEALSSADQFLRAVILEARGDFEQARMIFEAANAGLYTPEYHICRESQFHYLIEHLKNSLDPIVDLASGRCELVEEILREVDRPVVATDFSPAVLRRDQRWLQYFDLYDNVSLLAFDARKTPFKGRCVHTMTTNLGLANIEDPGVLMSELRRFTAGTFWALSVFYPPEDTANAQAIGELGLSSFLFRASAQENFSAAGWKSTVVNVCEGRALPTPGSDIIAGVQIDSLPAAETRLEWCILRAN
jgi:uncharacterized protein YbaR (Trm112 family)